VRSNPNASGIPAAAEATPAVTLEPHLQADERRYKGLELWLHRITVLMFVFVCATAGVLLVIIPWRTEWTDNHLLLGLPELRAIIASPFVRGLVSGLGVLDVWIGFSEAIHYNEHKRT
jgi:hypothetical protein